MGSLGRLAALASSQHGLIERGQASALGLDGDTLRRAVAAGDLQRVHGGVYRIAGAPSGRAQQLLAACLAGGDGTVVSHRAATEWWGGLPAGQPLDLTVTRTRQPRVPGAIVHRSRDLDAGHVTALDSVPVTTPARTLLDLGAVVPRWVVREVLERFLVERLMTPLEADQILDGLARRGRSGVGALRWVLDERALGSDVPDSILEVRMARLLAGTSIAAPMFQHRIVDGSGTFVARVDFAWPHRMVIVEVDGFGAHGSPTAMSADLARQNKLVALGWTVLRFTWEQVIRSPSAVIDQLRPVLGA